MLHVPEPQGLADDIAGFTLLALRETLITPKQASIALE